MLTLDQLLTFAGTNRSVRFNLEVKTDFITLTDAAVAVIRKHRLESRVDIQSFDLSALLHVHRTAPQLRTIALFADLPGLEPGPERFAGMAWPYRKTYAALPPRVQVSGGFEGMGLDPHDRLFPALEKPLLGQAHVLDFWRFDIHEKVFAHQLYYPLDERGVAVADVQFAGDGFIVIERDDTQGDPSGFKRIFTITGGFPGRKHELANLNDLDDGDGGRFTFPFWTIESLAPAPKGVLVMNDNNYPFSVGRHVDADQPDETELIHVQLWPR
jgi:glycerophosphoryl diester phosphodiesterase